MFRPVSSKPDLVAQEHEILARWARARDVRPAARPERDRRALELPRRADHGQQPDGRPPCLGPDVQGRLPALPRDARARPALPERVRLPGPVGRGQRRARPRLHEQARHRGVRDRRVRDAVQAARPDLRGAPDRAVDPARDVDGLERPRRAAPAARPARGRPGPGDHDRGAARRRSPTPSRCSSGGSGCPSSAAATSRSATRTTTSSGASSRSATGAAGSYKGHDTMPWCPRCGTGLSQMEMNEGYQDREDPGPDGPPPARRPAGRVAPRLDDDPVDAHRERGRGRRAGPPLRSRSARAIRTLLGRPRHAQGGARRARSRSSRSGPARELVGWRYRGPFDDLPAVARPRSRDGRATSTASWPGTRSARRRGPGSSTSRPGCGAEDYQLGKALGLPVVGADRRGRPLLRRASAG